MAIIAMGARMPTSCSPCGRVIIRRGGRLYLRKNAGFIVVALATPPLATVVLGRARDGALLGPLRRSLLAASSAGGNADRLSLPRHALLRRQRPRDLRARRWRLLPQRLRLRTRRAGDLFPLVRLAAWFCHRETRR